MKRELVSTTDPEVRAILAEWHSAVSSREEEALHPKAALTLDHSRLVAEDDAADYRSPYKHDLDRIIHSEAYSRYVDKTQVVYLVDNDHISHRSIHVQLVAGYARGLAEILGYNVNLVEAIALGHDTGHTPFGHEGEVYLSQLSQEHGQGSFAHPWQSCRILREIERLNLGLAVYDGFLCHDGGACGRVYTPNFDKSWDDHWAELDKKLDDPDQNIWPGTLEGCLVKLSDTVSYLARDIEDGISLGILSRDKLPKTALGSDNRQVLSIIAADVIKNSYKQDHVAISQEIYDAIQTLRKFNFEHFYIHPRLKVESIKIERSYRILFDLMLEEAGKGNEDSFFWKEYLHNKSEQYIEETPQVRQVIDYISGMTDGYFVRTFEALAVPRNIQLN